jgi:dTDP-4-amino-4,6-dideoxygalactose transaminase
VHLVGHVARVDRLLDAAAEHGVAIIEDATESLGASWVGGPSAGRAVGTLGAVGCFSFNGNKLLSTGGGGMAVTADATIAARIRHLATQAKLPGLAYRHDAAGFNYRLTNLAAAIGLAQVERLAEIRAAKLAIARRYTDAFAETAIEGPRWPADVAPVHWLSTVRVADESVRDETLRVLHEAGYEARALWPPLREHLPYRDAAVLGGEVAIDVSRRSINLPSSVALGLDDQQAIIDLLIRTAG